MTWVHVDPHAALISYPARRRPGVPWVPTFLVLGGRGPSWSMHRPTLGCGVVDVDESGTATLRVLKGSLPAELAPALLEAAQSLVSAQRAREAHP